MSDADEIDETQLEAPEIDGEPADWNDKQREYWMGLATTVGADEAHARFAFGSATGMSQAAAARFARYGGDARQAGYRAARTRRVKAILALAEADGFQSPNALVSDDEKRRLLNALMRSNDPNVRLRAIEADDKRRDREDERKREEAERGALADPERLLAEIAELAPELAIAMSEESGFPLPEAMRAQVLASRRKRTLEFLVAMPTDERAKLFSEVTMHKLANGSDTRPDVVASEGGVSAATG